MIHGEATRSAALDVRQPSGGRFPDSLILDDSAPSIVAAVPAKRWKVLIGDDEPSVHQVTKLVLENFAFAGQELEFLSAYSAREAIALMSAHNDVALILLDVVMESEDAGLKVVEHIRKVMGNRLVRIVLRTGQPGHAPEQWVAAEYDIDDYREKTDLTSARLLTAVRSALRAYRDITALDLNRRGLEMVARATAWMFRATDVQQLAHGVLEHLSLLLHFGCGASPADGLVTGMHEGRERIIAAIGRFEHQIGMELDAIGDRRILEAIRNATSQRDNATDENGLFTARFSTSEGHANALCVQCCVDANVAEAGFVDVFLHNVVAAFENVYLQLSLTREVAERREAVRAAEILARLPAELPDPVIRVSEDGVVKYANAASAPILAHFGTAIGGRLPAPWQTRAEEILQAGRALQFEIQHEDNIYEMSFLPVKEAGYLNLIARDVTLNRKLLTRLEHAAYHDHLTGIANRLQFKVTVEQAVASARRYGGQIGLMLLDLNHFKQLNDIWGHEAGDGALREIARRLRGIVRSADVIARLGGDEFGVVIPRLQSLAEMQRLADRINAALLEPICVGNNCWQLSCSIGLTSFPGDAGSADELMRCADLAMYQAKRDGSTGYRFYDSEIHRNVRKKTETEMLLRRAIEAKTLDVFYQPVVRLEDGSLLGSEALLRLRREDGTLVLPTQLIHVAEDTGLIEPIGRWLIEHVCTDIRSWLDRGLQVGSTSVNVSARQFRDKDLTRHIQDVLDRTAVPASTLEIEITESVLLGDEETALRIMCELREIGLTLAIDDFGTGYSSLSYLRRLPVSKLKIDQSFVADMLGNSDAAVITDAILSLGKSLGLRVLAEGIEQPQQVSRLRAIGCQEGQGYYFGKPSPRTDFERIVRQQGSSFH